MQALDAQKYLAEITGYLQQLCSVDGYREAYYKDLCELVVVVAAVKQNLLAPTLL